MASEAPRRPPAVRRPRLALAVSVALHFAVLAALGALSPPAPTALREPPTLRVTWVPRVEPAPEPAPAPDPEPEPPPVGAPPAPEPEPPAPLADAEAPPAPVEPEPPTEPEPPAAVAERPPPAAPPPAAEPPPPAAELEIDWARERERAVAMVVEQAEREREYRSFSLDAGDDEIGLPEPGADVDIFDGGRRRGASRAQVGRQRTAFGRKLVELCNALSGGGFGISMFGLPGLSLCADPAPWADFFGHLRPEYLESLPLCTEVPVDGAAAGPEGPETRIFCRLVPKDDPARRLVDGPLR